ncbi:hypothetical protein CEUSTIGMA_g9013.t1 [Chlamydomonas eustigma]|uniref:Uncharacterized protein n=1 Tax=Chlamydomonas eustigma TaxID=1157962 RepID=A0A250XET3_9CHLO|nr:hypothetical protein CEUSTIGMA_g9013.t1 [Chlamydomonas eustigma]|eukprot:GAX81585.1 hypothetical protein CEUSTIGMA_g9013.t1 [Chlamydomonas eustigma]
MQFAKCGREINVRSNTLKVGELDEIIESLHRDTDCQFADFSHITLTASHVKMLKQFLTANKVLIGLSLNSTGFNAGMVQELAQALKGEGSGKANTTLVDIDLSDNPGINDRGAQNLSEVLLEISKNNTRGGLRCLSMSNTGLTVDGVRALCLGLLASDSLEVLELENCQMDCSPSAVVDDPLKACDKAVSSISSMLQCNTRLCFLSLANCRLCTRSVGALATEIEFHEGLEGLDLSRNPFAAGGMDLMAQGIQNLRYLSLSAVNMCSTGFTQLLRALKENSALNELDVTHNFVQKIDGKVFREFNQKNTTLRKIDLRWNRLSPEVCESLSHAFTSRTKAVIIGRKQHQGSGSLRQLASRVGVSSGLCRSWLTGRT